MTKKRIQITPEMAADDILSNLSTGMKYLGGGFLPGVPARDLPGFEVSEYGRALLLASGLYANIEEKFEPLPEPEEG